MKKRFKWIPVLGALAIAFIFSIGFGLNSLLFRGDAAAGESQIKNVILFIGDGMGQEHVKAGAIYKGAPLSFQSFEHQGRNVTASRSVLDGLEGFTDSAAGGTAMATGKKTYNSMVARSKANKDAKTTYDLKTIIETASEMGYRTGVVTSDGIEGATPASFLSHADERHQYDAILKSMANSPADLIIGESPDKVDINKYIARFEANGFTYVDASVRLDKSAPRLLGTFPIFAEDLGYGTANLDDLTAFALDYLDNDNGFVLMVEGANIDKRSHDHNPAHMLRELMGFDQAVKAAMDWSAGRSDTLILVTADHETGGIQIENGATRENIADKITFHSDRYESGTYMHSNADVFYFATGMSSDLFKPTINNVDIYKAMAQAIGAAY